MAYVQYNRKFCRKLNSDSDFAEGVLSECLSVDCVLSKRFQPLYNVSRAGYLLYCSHKNSGEHVTVMSVSEVNVLNASSCSHNSRRSMSCGIRSQRWGADWMRLSESCRASVGGGSATWSTLWSTMMAFSIHIQMHSAEEDTIWKSHLWPDSHWDTQMPLKGPPYLPLRPE